MLHLFLYDIFRGGNMVEKQFKISQIDEDTYKVISLVNGKELEFKKNVELARKLSNVNADARIKMIKYMKESGITKDDLIEKRNRNGKIYYDETNYRMLEQGFITDNALELARNIFKTLFDMQAEEAIIYLEISSDKESNRLGNELRAILLGEKTPKKSQ